jgi:hypothetical protein
VHRVITADDIGGRTGNRSSSGKPENTITANNHELRIDDEIAARFWSVGLAESYRHIQP